MFTLHFGDEHPTGDRWFSSDKAKHFFTGRVRSKRVVWRFADDRRGEIMVTRWGEPDQLGVQHRKGNPRRQVGRHAKWQGSRLGCWLV
jgi:hypothetical protein